MTDEANAVQLGKLLLADKIGELLPRARRARRDGCYGFSRVYNLARGRDRRA